jgi:hypothetical protein
VSAQWPGHDRGIESRGVRTVYSITFPDRIEGFDRP